MNISKIQVYQQAMYQNQAIHSAASAQLDLELHSDVKSGGVKKLKSDRRDSGEEFSSKLEQALEALESSGAPLHFA